MIGPAKLGPAPRNTMPPADRVMALILSGLTLATRWPYRAHLLPTWDAVQFALALERYDVVRHQPHPPGYILYVALGRLAEFGLGEPAVALGSLAILASAAAVFFLYQLGWQLYGRGTALVAALGLVASPLFWAYGVVGLPYTAEAALTVAIVIGAWSMRHGRVRALVASAVLLGLGAGVRQSMLLTMSPLWLVMAWRGFRRPGPVLAGVGLIALTTTAWLGPMLWLTGIERYLAAGVDLYESTVRATTLFGDGWSRNATALGAALLVGMGVFLPLLAWGLRRTPGRLLRGGDRTVLFALWTLPALALYVFVHFGQLGYLLTILPACYLVVGRALMELSSGNRDAVTPRPGRRVWAGVGLGLLLGAHVAFFTMARPVDVPVPPAGASTSARLSADLRALYRFRLWSHTAAGLREQEAVIGDYVTAIRSRFDPHDTVLVTELGNPRSYPWFRHVMYYLPEYPAYHLRLGEASPGYLVSRDLRSMAALPERRIPLPVTTRRVVWVVDEWHPGLPRPAALEVQPLAHGRSLYVLRVRRGAIDYAGYRLVPVTAVARVHG
jgi:transmembrane protein TMEM260 (protein O-mannosyltransferase)